MAKQIYEAEGSDEASVPILYDKISKRIATNESAENVRMLNTEADALGTTIAPETRPDLYPLGNQNKALRQNIDRLNDQNYTGINTGAYKAGFSLVQAIYEAAFILCFETLDKLEARLAADNRPYLTGQKLTEADLHLFPKLFRHDPVY